MSTADDHSYVLNCHICILYILLSHGMISTLNFKTYPFFLNSTNIIIIIIIVIIIYFLTNYPDQS